MFVSLSHRAARFALVVAGLWLAGCESPDSATSSTPSAAEAPLAPDASVAVASLATSLGGPVTGLRGEDVTRFEAGKAEFEEIEEADEGLGPVFNEAGCAVCHTAPTGGTNDRLETRFGRLEKLPLRPPLFDALANLGGSLLQDHGIGTVTTATGSYTYEAEVVPSDANVVAGRITTPLFGLGLVDAVPDETFLALARLQAVFYPDTRGTPHLVKEIRTGRTRVGRFGWKAQVPTLFQFSGDAYLNEMGVTNPEFPEENCPQGDCSTLADNPLPSLNDAGDGVARFADFMTLLGPPPQLPATLETIAGRGVFTSIGCANCHTPVLVTGPSPIPALSGKPFQPFSDFLLHNMGALGDGIVQGNAGPREMRTAPLWGLHTRRLLLHDGRASSIQAAILAHDGQGARSSYRYTQLTDRARNALLAFLNTL